MKLTIRTKLICYFLSAILVAMAISGLFVNFSVSRMLKNNTELTSSQTVNESLGEFQMYLKTLSIPVDLMTRKREVKYIGLEGDYDTYVKSIQDSLIANQKVVNKPVRSYYALADGTFINAYLYYDEASGKDKNAKEVLEKPDSVNKDWYVNSIKSPSKSEHKIFSVFTEPYRDEEKGIDIITVSQEIRMNNATVGVVALDIEASVLESYIQSIPLLNTGYVVLADNDGNIIINNEKNNLGLTSLSGLNCWAKYEADMNKINAEKAAAEEAGVEYNGEDGNKTYTEVINGQKYCVTIIEDEITGWKFVGLISNEVENASNILELIIAIIIATLNGLVLGTIIALFVSISLSRSIKTVKNATAKLADGDFSVRINAKRMDEIGDLQRNFNEMTESVSALIKEVGTKFSDIYTVAGNVSTVSDTTKESVNQVTMAIQGVAIGATQQAESTQEANAEVEKLASSLEETKAYVEDINEMSKEANELSSQGIEVVGKLIEKTDRTKENSRISGEVIAEMLESINKINYMSDAIADITSQTNLLSLNASIEAARAGEAGKGFAVVADEIRKLADQSRESTDEIKNIVNEISEKSTLVSENLEESNKLQAEQQKAIDDTKELFNKISSAIEALINGLEKIDELNSNMVKGKSTVVSSMENIASVSEESAAAAEEVTASADMVNTTMEEVATYAKKLNDIAVELKEAISKFTL